MAKITQSIATLQLLLPGNGRRVLLNNRRVLQQQMLRFNSTQTQQTGSSTSKACGSSSCSQGSLNRCFIAGATGALFVLFASRFAPVPTFFTTSEPDDKLECEEDSPKELEGSPTESKAS